MKILKSTKSPKKSMKWKFIYLENNKKIFNLKSKRKIQIKKNQKFLRKILEKNQ